MENWVRLVGPQQAVELFGVKLVGVNLENGKKMLFSIVLVLFVVLVGIVLSRLVRTVFQGRRNVRLTFWAAQAIHLGCTILLIVGLLSVWFNDPARLATALGLVSAGLAFALQRVITALAGYLVILRGKTFNVGDRITMGGVRGDVIALGFIQTTIMEMGQPASEQSAGPTMWVWARQYTGRIVTVTNDKVFTEPIYNYSRDFPYIWEEMKLPIGFTADRRRAEQILLAAAQRHAVPIRELSRETLEEMRRRYFLHDIEMEPRVYYRLTDNWLELSLRFVVPERHIREIKDAMSRDILAAMEEAGLSIASTTFEIVGLPPLRWQPSASNGQPLPTEPRYS